MRPLRVVLAVGVLVLVLPSSVLAQVKTFNFSWYTECQTRNGVSGNQANAGLATLTPSASGGWQLRFSGPGTATGSADVSATDASGASSIQSISVPNVCSLPTAAPTGFRYMSAFTDPTGFSFDSIFQGGGGRLLAVGAAARTTVVSTITSPANGATVTGPTTVAASTSGVITGVPLTYHLVVDGREVSAASSATARASASWDSRTVGDGAHTLRVAVTDGFGSQLAFGEVTVTVANGGGGTTTPPPTTGTLRVAVTSPHDGDVVSGTSWVVIWVNGGTAGASDTYTLQLDGQTVATASTTSSGPVSMAWNTKAFLNGTHTLSATVRDNAGKTGSAKLGVLIRN